MDTFANISDIISFILLTPQLIGEENTNKALAYVRRCLRIYHISIRWKRYKGWSVTSFANVAAMFLFVLAIALLFTGMTDIHSVLLVAPFYFVSLNLFSFSFHTSRALGRLNVETFRRRLFILGGLLFLFTRAAVIAASWHDAPAPQPPPSLADAPVRLGTPISPP